LCVEAELLKRSLRERGAAAFDHPRRRSSRQAVLGSRAFCHGRFKRRRGASSELRKQRSSAIQSDPQQCLSGEMSSLILQRVLLR
jgi:hypothetical protein